DFILTKLSTHPIAKMRPVTLQALRAALYQLLWMDRLPDSAIINETIKALQGERQPRWLTGFVNGVLRAACRRRENLKNELKNQPLVTECNHPQWLVERWLKHFGNEETRLICGASNQDSHLCLRVNQTEISTTDFTDELDKQKIKYRQGLTDGAVWLLETMPVKHLPGYDEGWFSVQDETAQIITALMAPFTAGNYLDACAGLGGKTCALAQLIPTGSTLFALEPQKARYSLLQKNLQRLKLDAVCRNSTLREFAATAEIKFNAILIDAPCSGLGVTGRHPDIRWNREAADLIKFQKQQLELLRTAASLLAPHGLMVYATCSMEPEENEEVIRLFCKNNPAFTIINAAQILSAPLATLINQDGFLSTKPGPDSHDGFFGAVIKR
ncbi:MAG TPA: 16S rRNA (cytosine(967)-C(5))-methyltransferase, partial [Desulfobacterales bacterium]|nr:16S rRNA (cytosine(967)-C(5))-methyltransferase [Desulfobacterales bacterium]